MEDRKLYQILAGKVQHLSTLNDMLSNATGRDDELARLEEIADRVEQDLSNLRDLLPSGSGIDNGTRIDIRKCWVKSDEVVKLTLNTSYHHMNDTGYYDGWTDHVVTIRPTLTSSGFSLAITGRNRNDIKDYLGEVFEGALNEPVRETIEIQEGDKRTVSYRLARFLDPPAVDHCPRAKSEPCPGCGEGGTGDPTDHAIGCQFFNDN